jgi:hypothetical protein
MRVWRLITHHSDRDHALFWTKQNSRIAIGWGAIGDIRIKGLTDSLSSLRDLVLLMFAGPALKRWAISGRPLGTFE